MLCMTLVGVFADIQAQEPEKVLLESNRMGFLEARFDSVLTEDGVVNLNLVPGQVYYWDELIFDFNEEVEWSAKAKKYFPRHGDTFETDKVSGFLQLVLNTYENQGYPFVSISLSDITLTKGAVRARLIVNKGKRIVIDSLISRGSDVVSQKVLERLTGLSTGSWYNQQALEESQTRLMSTAYIKSDRPVEVGFFSDKAWVYFTPVKQASNHFDALIGFAPGGNSSTKLNLTGHINLGLINLFQQGESLSFKWEAPGSGTQRLVSHAVIPYLMGWPIGLSGGVELYKRDTSYLTLESEIGFRVSLQPNHWLDLQMVNRSSSEMGQVKDRNLQEFKLTLVRLSYMLDKLQPVIYPRSGWYIQPRIGFGRKMISGDGAGLINKNHIEIDADIGLLLQIGKQFGFSFTGTGGYRSGMDLAENEKYRLGGYTILKGFQEESLTADMFAVASAECRFYLSEGSNLHLFTDFGYLANHSADVNEPLLPIGVGMGLQLKTRAGLLNLDYAIGSSRDQAFALQNGLIHLGIKSIF